MNRLTEESKFVQSLIPATRAAGTFEGASTGGTNGWIPTDGYDEATVLFNFGAIAAGVTPIDASVYEADSTGGAGTKITGSDIVTMADGDDDNALVSVNVRLGGRAAGTRKKYIRPHLVLGGAGNADCAITVILSKAKNTPTVNSPVSVNV